MADTPFKTVPDDIHDRLIQGNKQCEFALLDLSI